MKQYIKYIFFGIVLIISTNLEAQSPRIRLNQITKDSITGSILISSLSDSNMVYSRDFYINAADTSLVFYGTTIVSGSGGGSFVTTTVLSDSLVNYIGKLASFGGDVSGTYDAIVVADNSHDHTISNVTGLQTALDGKSNVGHTHVISDISGLQTALDGKQAQLNGTGFVKASGTTITYDNSTYLTTEVDGSITNEGALSVGAGGANDAVINSNTSGSTGVTIAGGSNVTVTESGSTITIASTGGGGGGGTVTDVIAGTQISGMGMTIASSTTTPTISTSITDAANFRTAIGAGTLSTEVDGSVTNEGSLSVGAGGANDAIINSNTSGSTGVTIAGGSNVTVTESGSTITIASTGGGSSFNNLTESGDTIKVAKSFGADSLNFFVDAANNRVGIGTTTPENTLDIKGGITVNVDSSFTNVGAFAPFTAIFRGDDDQTRNLNFRVEMRSNFATNRPSFALRRARVDNSTGLLSGVLNNDVIGAFAFQAALSNGDLGNVSAYVQAFADADATSTGAPARLSFGTGSNSSDVTERLTIKSDGKIGIGTTAPADKLHTYSATGSVSNRVQSGDIGNTEFASFFAEAESRFAGYGVTKHSGITNNCAYWSMDSESGTNYYLWIANTGRLRGSTTASHIGTTSGTAVGAGDISDKRLKIDHGDFNYGLEAVKKLSPAKFQFINDPDNKIELGFYAQDVINIIPEVVYDTKIELKQGEPTQLAMSYQSLIPVLTKAIQEQQIIIDQQKSEIETLKTQIQLILTEIEQIKNN